MSEYKHGDWCCVPADESEAHEIQERAVASGAVLIERVKTNGSIGYKWDTFNAWGVHLGKTYTAYTDKGEPFCGAIQYTIEELRQKFPLPGEQTEEPKQWRGPEDGLPPVGTVCECKMGPADVPRQCMIVGIHPATGNLIVDWSLEIPGAAISYSQDFWIFRPLRTEREKWIEAAMDVSELRARDGAKQVFGEIYDALQSGALKAPEVK